MRPIDADALYNGAMKDEYFSFKEHDKNGRESFAYSCAMQRLAEAPTIDVIPIDWIRAWGTAKQAHFMPEAIRLLLDGWQEEGAKG